MSYIIKSTSPFVSIKLTQTGRQQLALGRLNFNKQAKDKDRKRRGVKDVIVTRGTIEDVIDETGNVNIDQFIKNITLQLIEKFTLFYQHFNQI
jgi:hypothetical protein